MTMPGDRLRRVLAGWIDEATMRDVVDPTIADLQHELGSATAGARAAALRARACVDLFRALLLHGAGHAAPIRSAAAVVAIGVAGGLLYAKARLTVPDPRVFHSALLLPMAIAALALRFTGGARNYRRQFTALLAVSVLIWSVSAGFLQAASHVTLLHAVVGSSLNLGALAVLSAIGAAATWSPPGRPAPQLARLILGLLASAATAAGLYFLTVWLSGAPDRHWLIAAPFYVAIFAVPIAVTSLPMLFVARRWIGSSAGLASFGALVSPTAMMVVLWLETGGLRAVVQCLHDAPVQSALMTIPFTVANGVLALNLFEPPFRPAR